MLFTERNGACVAVLTAGADAIGRPWVKTKRAAVLAAARIVKRSALLGAIARRDLLVGGVLGGLILDHRVEDRAVRLVVVGDHLPGLAVPLLDTSDVGALVVLAGELQRAEHAFEAQLLDAGGG